MFIWKEKLTVKEEIDKVTLLDSTARGSNRRAVGLIPAPIGESAREISEARKLRYQQLLISIEGKQSTCCLKIYSPKRKSRSALLAFRGRVLGCIYGRKELESQLMGYDAFEQFQDDISVPESIVDTYILPEELALAAGSLFHGEVYHQPSDATAIQTFQFVYKNLVKTQMPGCIVLKRMGSDEVVSFIYMFGGRMVGIYSFADGWLESSYQQAAELIEGRITTIVSASKLNANNVEEVHDLTFSLTGIDRGSAYRPVLRPLDF